MLLPRELSDGFWRGNITGAITGEEKIGPYLWSISLSQSALCLQPIPPFLYTAPDPSWIPSIDQAFANRARISSLVTGCE